MAMTMQGQELFISAMAKIVVDVAIQNNPEYNKFMDAIISSFMTMARVEKLLDDNELNVAVAIINNRAKEIISVIDFSNDELHRDIDDIINRALNSDE